MGSLVAFTPWIKLILLDAPVFSPSGALARRLRLQPYNVRYKGMMAAVHVDWGLMPEASPLP